MINKYSIPNGVKNNYLGMLQTYFVLVSAKRCTKYFSGTTQTYWWKSNSMSEESLENITKSGDYFAPPILVNYYPLPHVKFNGHCLITNNISIPKKVINLYVSYIIDAWSRDLNTDFTLGNCLFGSVKLTKNTDADKYKYNGYSIGFDTCSEFSLTEVGWVKLLLLLLLLLELIRVHL